MRKFTVSLVYLMGILINAALILVGWKIIEAGAFAGRAGHITTGSEALFFGLLFVAVGLGGGITLLIAGARHLLGKRRPDDANGKTNC